MKTVVITGASTGIGAATAGVLVRAGFRVFGSVRRNDDGNRMAAALGPSFVPLVFDVTDAAAVDESARVVDAALGGATLSGLVNNAGIAVVGPLLHLATDDLRRQLEINLIGQHTITRAFAPLLGADPRRTGTPGRIVVISSVAGRTASPFMGAYNASKFGLEGWAEALRRELILFGIDVAIVAPGPIATPIWDKVEAIGLDSFSSSPYLPALTRAQRVIADGKLGLPAERVGEVVLTALTSRRPRIRYTVTPHRLQQWLIDVLPRRAIDRIAARRLGLRKDDRT